MIATVQHTQKDPRNPLKFAWQMVLLMASLIALCAFLSGCRSVRYVPVETIRTDSVYISKVKVDSFIQRDSVNTFIKGDTITIYKERWRERYAIIHDTIISARIDSIPYPVEVVKEKNLSFSERLKIRSFPLLFVAVVLLGLFAWIKTRR